MNKITNIFLDKDDKILSLSFENKVSLKAVTFIHKAAKKHFEDDYQIHPMWNRPNTGCTISPITINGLTDDKVSAFKEDLTNYFLNFEE